MRAIRPASRKKNNTHRIKSKHFSIKMLSGSAKLFFIDGDCASPAGLARKLGISRAKVSQVMNLLG